MIQFLIQMDELLGFARMVEEMRKKTKEDAANALNAVGDGMVRNLVGDISAQTGLAPEKIRGLLNVKKATPTNLEFQLDSSKVTDQAFMGDRRRWPKGRQGVLRPGTLVNIITMEDDKVCQKCQDARDEGPYDLETAKQMLPIHPNCRCLLWAAEPVRRAKFDFQRQGDEGPMTEAFTLRQLAEEIRNEQGVSIKAFQGTKGKRK